MFHHGGYPQQLIICGMLQFWQCSTKVLLTNQFSLVLFLLCVYYLYRDKLWFETSLQDLDMAESGVDKVCLRDCPEHEHCNVAARDCVCDYGYVRNRRQDCISTGQLFYSLLFFINLLNVKIFIVSYDFILANCLFYQLKIKMFWSKIG